MKFGLIGFGLGGNALLTWSRLSSCEIAVKNINSKIGVSV